MDNHLKIQTENPKIINNAIQSIKRKINTIETIAKKIVELKEKVKKEQRKPTITKRKVERLEEIYDFQFPLDYLMFVEEISNGLEFEGIKVYPVEEAVELIELNLIPLLSFGDNLLTYQTEFKTYYLNEKPMQTMGGVKTNQSFVRRILVLLNEENKG